MGGHAIAVVDAGGRVVTVDRMDGAPFGVVDVAIDVTGSAVVFGPRQTPGALHEATHPTGDWHRSR